MSQQDALFYDRIENALDAVIAACGGRKKMAGELWPDKPVRDAHNLLDACLNHERREKFDPTQIIYILRRGREVGCHGAMNFIAGETGYAATPVSPEAERDRLADAILQCTTTLERALKAAERLPQSPPHVVRAS